MLSRLMISEQPFLIQIKYYTPSDYHTMLQVKSIFVLGFMEHLPTEYLLWRVQLKKMDPHLN